ncbi:flagellin FliC [Aquabacterium olei]|uniref:Flagellin n=1 Tax=Aquabacterium olei TaxID=1296669 RepID=A0A2U8FTC2_9BURK|nr:flagellin [Aquabacterium olei]AWI54311.1 flagellin FliC [Aquabacterium olei]
MPQTINTNIVSLNAQRNLNSSQNSLAISMQRLSSGMRVNSAKDDAAGMAIAERMNSQIRGMNVAVRNANDAISMSQTAEGALGKIGDNLQRMRELAVQSRNATNSTGDRANLQKEFLALQAEISRTINGTSFNGKKLFDGTSGTLDFQIGAGTTNDDRISIDAVDLYGAGATDANKADASSTVAATRAALADGAVLQTAVLSYGDDAQGISIGGVRDDGTTAIDGTDIDAAINVIDEALTRINDNRASFGAAQNRFEAVIANLQVNVENQSAARGRIMDADFAAETANLSRAQILQQAGNAMVAQANQLPQQVLKLLQG